MEAIRKMLKAIGTIFRFVCIMTIMCFMAFIGILTILSVKVIGFAVIGATFALLIAYIIEALFEKRRNR